MLRKTLLALFVVAFLATLTGCTAEQDERKGAVHRQRSVIFNNDGDDAWCTCSNAPATPEGFLSLRQDQTYDCGVSSVFYCTTQNFNLFTHDSKLTEIFVSKEGFTPRNRMKELLDAGTDPLALTVEACRKRNVEVFWSLRMNDIHDNYHPHLMSQWKRDNPQFLMGTIADFERFPRDDGRNVWTFVDYSHPPVRDRIVEIVRDVVTRYDVDGIDLDFMRHTCYFKEVQLYQPVTAEHMDMMTDMVSKVSKVVHEASRSKGKPVLLSVRVFPTLELNRRFGFDVQRWAESGYLDFIAVGGGYDPFTMPAKDMIDRGHAWGMPVYVCLSNSGMEQRGVTDSDLSGWNYAAWRAAAANAWALGPNGIMTFNVAPELADSQETRRARTVWKEIGDPKGLVGKDKLYCIENLSLSYTQGYMMRSVPWEDRLPAALAKGTTVTRVLPVADDIPNLADRLKSLRLRVFLAGLKPGDDVQVIINGKPLSASPEKPGWLAADVSPSLMRKGPNEITVAYGQGAAAELSIGSVELSVQYQPAG